MTRIKNSVLICPCAQPLTNSFDSAFGWIRTCLKPAACIISYNRINQHLEQLRGWDEHMDQARRLMAEFAQSGAFRDLVINGIAPDGSVELSFVANLSEGSSVVVKQR